MVGASGFVQAVTLMAIAVRTRLTSPPVEKKRGTVASSEEDHATVA